MASFNMYRIVTTTTSTPMNVVSGTTAAPASNATYLDKGCEVTFQNQSTAATAIWIGGSAMQITSIGATSTLGVTGIMIPQNGSYSFGKRHAPSAINLNDFWIASTSSNAICVVHVIKAV